MKRSPLKRQMSRGALYLWFHKKKKKKSIMIFGRKHMQVGSRVQRSSKGLNCRSPLEGKHRNYISPKRKLWLHTLAAMQGGASSVGLIHSDKWIAEADWGEIRLHLGVWWKSGFLLSVPTFFDSFLAWGQSSKGGGCQWDGCFKMEASFPAVFQKGCWTCFNEDPS